MYTFDESIVSDLHKDTYGFRPDSAFWSNWNVSSDAGKQYIWDCLLEAFAHTIEINANEDIAAINDFELEIANTIDLGATSREVAIRWIIESMGLTETDLVYGGSYVCFLKKLPYSMAPLFENAIRDLERNFIKEAA
jgi:hypothetical protein